jgi:hypothetical protein
MFWEFRSVFDGISDEYRGWRKFRRATGTWPICSVLAGIFSIPACVASGTYFFIKALNTGRLPLIYMALFVSVTCGVALWYGVRRLACKLDVARVRSSSKARTLEQFIRELLALRSILHE